MLLMITSNNSLCLNKKLNLVISRWGSQTVLWTSVLLAVFALVLKNSLASKFCANIHSCLDAWDMELLFSWLIDAQRRWFDAPMQAIKKYCQNLEWSRSLVDTGHRGSTKLPLELEASASKVESIFFFKKKVEAARVIALISFELAPSSCSIYRDPKITCMHS